MRCHVHRTSAECVALPNTHTVPSVHTQNKVVVATCSLMQVKGQLLTDVSVGCSGRPWLSDVAESSGRRPRR